MSLYYEPNMRLTVGSVQFLNCAKMVIKESVKELGDNAIITLPRNYSKLNQKSVLDYISVGDRVLIEAGINGKLFSEFSGWLEQIESDAPMILHVDDEFFPFKRTNYLFSWQKVSLNELLTYIAPGYSIVAPDVNLGAFQINNASAYKVLLSLKEQYGFFSYIRNNTLYCQFAFDVRGENKHTYSFGDNIKKNNLKYHRSEDVKVKIKAISNQRNGKKIIYETGSSDSQASLRTLNFGDMLMSDLKLLAEKTYSQLAFDGYSGSILGFATPRTHAGDILHITDENQADREGDYLIEKTIIRYSLTGGFERENTLSYKV